MSIEISSLWIRCFFGFFGSLIYKASCFILNDLVLIISKLPNILEVCSEKRG